MGPLDQWTDRERSGHARIAFAEEQGVATELPVRWVDDRDRAGANTARVAGERGQESRMNREQLAHVLRAAARIADDNDILVIGSQAILASYAEDALPLEATTSIEADIAFRNDPHDVKADEVDGAIGEGSIFHQSNSYYAQGVGVSTAVLPDGWEERVVAYERADAEPAEAFCLDPHDLVVSKIVAGREKDITFAQALIRSDLVDVGVLLDRAELLPKPHAVIQRVRASITRCSNRAQQR
jgi:hypothetical protein